MPEASLPTQTFVEVKTIRDGVVFLKKGGLRRVLIVNGLNFDLKSDAEQNLILSSFQNFLNTLDFPVQFFIHSRKVNIDAYLERINMRKQEESNELLKIQIEEYINFIKTFVEENAIITKTFFTIVPYEPVGLESQTKGLLSLLSFQKKSGEKAKQDEESLTKEHLEQLGHRVDEVIAGLSQIGLRAVPLEDEELIELFYNMYNPQLVEKRGLEIAKSQ